MDDFEKHFKDMLHSQGSEGKMSFADELFPSAKLYLNSSVKQENKEELPKSSSEKGTTIESLRSFLDTAKSHEEGPFQDDTIIKAEVKSDWKEDQVVVFKVNNGKTQLEVKNIDELSNVDLLLLGNPDDESNYDKIDELDFTQEKWVLLSRMIGALNIPLQRIVFALPWSNTGESKLETQIYGLKPKIIMTLGAMATNEILDKKERLTKVHGKLFPKTWKFKDNELVETQIFPLFHPQFLVINPNMKRTAWLDLQKCMEFLSA